VGEGWRRRVVINASRLIALYAALSRIVRSPRLIARRHQIYGADVRSNRVSDAAAITEFLKFLSPSLPPPSLALTHRPRALFPVSPYFFSLSGIRIKRSRERNSFDRGGNAIFARMPPRPSAGRSCEEMHRADYLEPRKWNTVISVSRERNPISLLCRGFVRIPRNKGSSVCLAASTPPPLSLSRDRERGTLGGGRRGGRAASANVVSGLQPCASLRERLRIRASRANSPRRISRADRAVSREWSSRRTLSKSSPRSP